MGSRISLSIIFFLVGISLLAGGAYLYWHASQVASGNHAEGIVTDVQAISAPSNDRRHNSSVRNFRKKEISFYPKIGFSADGKQYNFTSSLGSNPASYNVGDKVDVVYDPADPSKAEINSFMALWAPVILVLVMGALFTIVPVFIMARL